MLSLPVNSRRHFSRKPHVQSLPLQAKWDEQDDAILPTSGQREPLLLRITVSGKVQSHSHSHPVNHVVNITSLPVYKQIRGSTVHLQGRKSIKAGWVQRAHYKDVDNLVYLYNYIYRYYYIISFNINICESLFRLQWCNAILVFNVL